MTRNAYDDAFGVVRLRWHSGEPSTDTHGPVLCEVWRPRIVLFEALKPQVRIDAIHEVRVFAEDKWWQIWWNGQRKDVRPGDVRRHCVMRSRSWSRTITIDAWAKE